MNPLKQWALNKMLKYAVLDDNIQSANALIEKGADINFNTVSTPQYLFSGGIILDKKSPYFWDLYQEEEQLITIDFTGLINDVRSLTMLEFLLSKGLEINLNVFGKSQINFFNYKNMTSVLNEDDCIKAVLLLNKYGFNGILFSNGANLLDVIGLSQNYINLVTKEFKIKLNHKDDLNRTILFKVKEIKDFNLLYKNNIIPFIKNIHGDNALNHFEKRETIIAFENGLIKEDKAKFIEAYHQAFTIGEQ